MRPPTGDPSTVRVLDRVWPSGEGPASLARDPDPAVTAWVQSVASLRPGATAAVFTVEPSDVPGLPQAAAVATAVAVAAGFWRASSWWVLPPRPGLDFLSQALWCNLAYGTPEMPADEAARLAGCFMGFFAPDGVLFTNRSRVNDRSYGSTPIAPATFEGGVVAVGAGRAGIVWIQDED